MIIELFLGKYFILLSFSSHGEGPQKIRFFKKVEEKLISIPRGHSLVIFCYMDKPNIYRYASIMPLNCLMFR